MKKRYWIMGALLLLAVVLCLAAGSGNMEKKVRKEFLQNRETLCSGMEAYFGGKGDLTDTGNWKAVNHWSGRHEMVEYVTGARGDTYYGFYYSPDRVPLAFQNVDVPLVWEKDRWTWKGEGDNSGFTKQMEAEWYYFEASF